MVRAQFAYREQRRHPRRALHPKTAFTLGDGAHVPAACRDISLGGAFIESTTLPVFGTTVTVHFELEGQAISIPATVRWTSPEGFGVQFGLLGARETSLLVGLLSA
jgi:type IV pilus assembly protein PilZ